MKKNVYGNIEDLLVAVRMVNKQKKKIKKI